MISKDSEIIGMYIDGYLISEIASDLFCSTDEVTDRIVQYRANRVIKLTKAVENNIDNLNMVKEFVMEGILKIQKKENADERRKIVGIIKLTEDGMTLASAGNAFSITRERIRQILNMYAPELIIAKVSNMYRICGVCGKSRRGVSARGSNGQICDTCYGKVLKINKAKWSRDYDKCIDCGTTKLPHKVKGRCGRCAYVYNYNYDLKRKKAIKKSSEKWRKNNLDKVKDRNKFLYSERRKGALNGNREKALKRDGYKCVKCGLSAEESLKKYSRSLYVAHLGDKQDDSLGNLITYCSACHNGIFSRSKRKWIAP